MTTEPAFFVLTALVDQPRHGYGIVGEVAELSQGRVQQIGRASCRERV